MSSCSGDDDDEGGGDDSYSLVGTWVCEEGYIKETFIFNSNGTGKYNYYIELEYYKDSWDTKFTYTYNRSSSTVKILYNGDDEPYTYYVRFISSNEMMLEGFTFVRSDGDDTQEPDPNPENQDPTPEPDSTPEPEPTPEKGNRTFNVRGVEFTMVYVEGGTFMMGTEEWDGNDVDLYWKGMPVHQVTLSDYYIGETEVTQALWKVVMESNPSKFKNDDNRPVETVYWNDCQEFIGRLNEITGENFCLPTEAQWEFAACGGNYSKGYKYSGSNDLDAVAWYIENSDKRTHPVGTKQANELGIYDMSGNVYEWCQDWYGNYSSTAVTDPTGPSSGSLRVYRGGSWDLYAIYFRCAYRNGSTPANAHKELGLRLALK